MNVVSTARKALKLSQTEFGEWLAKELGRSEPIPFQRISDWENGRKSPRKNVRDICAPISAIYTAKELECADIETAAKKIVECQR